MADMSLAPLLAAVLPQMPTVHTVVAVGDGDLDAAGRVGQDRRSLRRPAGRPADPVRLARLDEKSAAAMCYTSGTTGNPKGVVYSHRSAYLQSMAICAGLSGSKTTASCRSCRCSMPMPGGLPMRR